MMYVNNMKSPHLLMGSSVLILHFRKGSTLPPSKSIQKIRLTIRVRKTDLMDARFPILLFRVGGKLALSIKLKC
jgi:hypothetical protein